MRSLTVAGSVLAVLLVAGSAVGASVVTRARATAAPTDSGRASSAPAVGWAPWCEPIPPERLALLDGRNGFASAVTGGAEGCLYRVTTLADSGPGSLRDAISRDAPEPRWIVFDVSGTIWLHDILRMGANRTIDGRGADITIDNSGIHMNGGGNLIIANVRLQNAWGDDLLQITHGASPFWIDHVTFFNAADEYLDINTAGEYPFEGTISWSRFIGGGPASHREDMAILIGDHGARATNSNIHVTMHHNYFDGTRQRQPLITGTRVHSYNNLIRYRLYGMLSRDFGDIVSENDIFDGQVVETERNRSDTTIVESPASLTQLGAYFRAGARQGPVTNSSTFWPAWHYDYALDPADDWLAERIQNWSGRQEIWP